MHITIKYLGITQFSSISLLQADDPITYDLINAVIKSGWTSESKQVQLSEQLTDLACQVEELQSSQAIILEAIERMQENFYDRPST